MFETQTGRTLGSYTLDRRIGQGGMADVYLAHGGATSDPVAIKLLHPARGGRNLHEQRFRREVRTLMRLNHPNIVPILDCDLTANRPYFVMPYFAGGSLRQRLAWLRASGDWLTLAEAVRIMLELADALTHAHAHGLVHRDIKPANVLFADDGRAVLSDFGIVKRLDGAGDVTQAGVLIGTPAYLAPEQALGAVGDGRSDIYALGVLFFLLLTGRLPYEADAPLAVVLKHIDEPTPYPSEYNHQLPAALEQIVLRALAKNPDARYPTMGEFAAALRATLRGGLARDGWHWVAALPPALLQPPRATPPSAPTAARSDAMVGDTLTLWPTDRVQRAGWPPTWLNWAVAAVGLVLLLALLLRL